MGRGFIKQKNSLKKKYLATAVKYIEQLEKENEELKSNPDGVVGQFVGQFRELYSQNSRLSVLAAALIKKLGDSVELTKEEMEAFQQNRINIKWEIPDGYEGKPEEAPSYVFTYELAPATEAPTSVVPQTENPAVEMPTLECNDPNCTLPKDLKHAHLAPVEAGETVYVDDVPNVDDPQSGKVMVVAEEAAPATE